ncbi:hypothetical protein, partial [Acinetobacter baumannii]|uniref:hypothetical protein n=1 Tax=Acinetobacter baumannii TaxID=470 RepID=UPI00339138AA
MTSDVAWHHIPWRAGRVGRRQALHAIITLVLYTRIDDVAGGMPSSPFNNTHDGTTLGMSCPHSTWT